MGSRVMRIPRRVRGRHLGMYSVFTARIFVATETDDVFCWMLRIKSNTTYRIRKILVVIR